MPRGAGWNMVFFLGPVIKNGPPDFLERWYWLLGPTSNAGAGIEPAWDHSPGDFKSILRHPLNMDWEDTEVREVRSLTDRLFGFLPVLVPFGRKRF